MQKELWYSPHSDARSTKFFVVPINRRSHKMSKKETVAPVASPAVVDPAVAVAKAEAKAKADAAKAEAKKAADEAKAVAKAAADEAKAKAKAEKEAAAHAAKAEKEAKAKAAAEAKAAAKPAKPAKVAQPSQNGVTRPRPEGSCGKVWALADAISARIGQPVPIAMLSKETALAGLNDATTRTQYARWKTFNGVFGAVAKPAEAVAATPSV
jgi:hypothetical protein